VIALRDGTAFMFTSNKCWRIVTKVDLTRSCSHRSAWTWCGSTGNLRCRTRPLRCCLDNNDVSFQLLKQGLAGGRGVERDVQLPTTNAARTVGDL